MNALARYWPRPTPARLLAWLALLLAAVHVLPSAKLGNAQAPSGVALRTALADTVPLRGPVLRPEALAGKALLLTFYASWCPPCTPEFDAFNEVRDAIGADRLTIVAVNVHEGLIADTTGRMARFLARTAPRFTVLGETPRAAAAVGGVPRIPTVYLFDADDRLAYSFVHARGARKMNTGAAEILGALAAIGLAPG